MNGTVLVVDDDEATSEIIATALEDERYRLRVAIDGASLSVALAEQPDVILLDLWMPGMDGQEASQRLRADPATAHIPIVALSVLSLQHAQERYPALIADDWLFKPFNLEDLYAIVEWWRGPE